MAKEGSRKIGHVALRFLPLGIGLTIGGLIFNNFFFYIGVCMTVAAAAVAIAYRIGRNRRD